MAVSRTIMAVSSMAEVSSMVAVSRTIYFICLSATYLYLIHIQLVSVLIPFYCIVLANQVTLFERE